MSIGARPTLGTTHRDAARGNDETASRKDGNELSLSDADAAPRADDRGRSVS